MQIEIVKCWNQAPLAISDKYKADLGQGDLLEKPWFCYGYKRIPKLFFTPKRGKPIFPSCPQLYSISTYTTQLTTPGSNRIVFYIED